MEGARYGKSREFKRGEDLFILPPGGQIWKEGEG